MVYSFVKPWYEEIADITESQEWETATIEIRNPKLVTSTYDVATGQFVQSGDPVLATTRARGIGVRASLNVANDTAGDPTGTKNYRWQFPHAAFADQIKRGFQIRVTECERNPNMLSYLFFVDADNLSTNQASRTIECTVDVEVDAGWQ